MRTLKVKQYIHRFNQFEETFESDLRGDSEEYVLEIQKQFDKKLAADGIAPVNWSEAHWNWIC